MSTPKSHRSHESQLEFGPTNPFVVQILASEADNVDEIKLSLSLLTPPTLPANISTLRWFTFYDGKLQRQQKHDAIEEEKNKCVLNDKAWQSHKTSNRTSPGGRSQTDIDTDTSPWLNMNMKKKIQKLWAFYYSESRVLTLSAIVDSTLSLRTTSFNLKLYFFFSLSSPSYCLRYAATPTADVLQGASTSREAPLFSFLASHAPNDGCENS